MSSIATNASLDPNVKKALETIGVSTEPQSGVSTNGGSIKGRNEPIESFSPVDGAKLGEVRSASREDYDAVLEKAQEAFKKWRKWPAPDRGEVVRQMGVALRDHKEELGAIVSYEMGKSLQEGKGEVQEMIDIADFATGQAKQLYGFTMESERPDHRLYEHYQPLGPIGLITAFNFPVAVWAWNVMIAWVCGDTTVWKPSEKTPITSLACQKLASDVFARNDVPDGVSNLVLGGKEIGQFISHDERLPLVSATGSIEMGRQVGQDVAKRLGKSLLELGGNNAIIISQHADLESTLVGAIFGAVGTAGQRCTSTRRLIIHESIYEEVKEKLLNAYKQLSIGDPLDENNHVGPLIDRGAVEQYQNALKRIEDEGGKILNESGVLQGEGYETGCYVRPVIAEAENEMKIVQEETFAPILYIMKYKDMDEAMEKHNGVIQGLSSAIMTTHLREAEHFLSEEGSDCGIANVNIGTSGAEIGGAFGGEKATGGGRESGSDAWKIYMRRQTTTINYSKDVPLAQGIKFEL